MTKVALSRIRRRSRHPFPKTVSHTDGKQEVFLLLIIMSFCIVVILSISIHYATYNGYTFSNKTFNVSRAQTPKRRSPTETTTTSACRGGCDKELKKRWQLICREIFSFKQILAFSRQAVERKYLDLLNVLSEGARTTKKQALATRPKGERSAFSSYKTSLLLGYRQ